MKSKIKDSLGIVFLLGIFSFFMVSPQIYKHSLIVSNDWLFHMNRFYETAMQIQNGTFNYFQSLYGFNQSGRVINAMYGSDFAYLNGLLLLLAKNWFRFQLLSAFSCFFVSGLSMYLLTRYCQINKKISLASAVLYMGTPTIVYYTVAQNFSGWGAAFLPLAFIPAIRMIRNHNKPIHPVFFGLAISLLISVHMFSTLLAVAAIVSFFIVGLYFAQSKARMIRDAVLAVLVAIGLSFNTFAAFFDLSADTLIPPYRVTDLLSSSTTLSYDTMGWTKFGLIFSFIFVLQIFYSILNWKKISLTEKLINFVGAAFLLVSSRYIPWNSLGNHFSFLQRMQFPQRFGVVACILLILGFAFTIQKLNAAFSNKESYQLSIVFALTLAMLSLTAGYSAISDSSDAWNGNEPLSRDTHTAQIMETDPAKIREAFGGKNDLNKAFEMSRKPTPDYLPSYSEDSFDSYQLYTKEIFENDLGAKIDVTDKNELSYTFDTQEKEVIVPAIIYHNSTVELNGRALQKSDYSVTPIGALKITPKSGENQVVVGYKPSLLFRLSIVVRLLTIGIICVYFVKTYSKKTPATPRKTK